MADAGFFGFGVFFFFCSFVSFHLDHNGSKLTQMLLLIMAILYSQSVIFL